MNEIQYKLSLDCHKPGVQKTIYAKENDTLSRKLIVSLTENGKPYTIPPDATAIIKALKPDDTIIFNNCIIGNNNITVTLTSQFLSCIGEVKCEICIIKDDVVLSTPCIAVIVEDSMYGDDAIESTNEYTMLVQSINQAQVYNNTAISSVEIVDGELIITYNDETIQSIGKVIGDNAYVHIKYSEVEPIADSDMSDEPNNYMGIYSGDSETAPTSYEVYSWFEIRKDNTVTYYDKYSDLPEDADAGQACYVANNEIVFENTETPDFFNPDISETATISFDNAFLLENPTKPTAQDYSVYDWMGENDCFLIAQDGAVIRFALYYIVLPPNYLMLYLVVNSEDPASEESERIYIFTWEDITIDLGYGDISLLAGWNWEVVAEKQYQHVDFDDTKLNQTGRLSFEFNLGDDNFYDFDPQIQIDFQNLFGKCELISHPKGMYIYNDVWQFNDIEEPNVVENYDIDSVVLYPENNTIYKFGQINQLNIMDLPDNKLTVYFNTRYIDYEPYYYTNLSFPDGVTWEDGVNGELKLNGYTPKNAILTIEHGIASVIVGGETGV